MTDYPVFQNPPIVETLLDIQVVPSSETDLARLAGIQDRIKDRYPNRRERTHWDLQANFAGERQPQTSARGGVIGSMFLPPEPEQTKVVQARLNGFGFSKLRPYENWTVFRDEAKELWAIYEKAVAPVSITGLSLTTLNRLELPLPLVDFKQYLLTGPDIAPGLPPGLAQFFMQLVVPQPDSPIVSIITSAIEPPPQPDPTSVTVLFNTDIVVQQPFDPNSDAIWDTFERLRGIRNEIFFKSLTDKAKELF